MEELLKEIRGCELCKEHLPLGPRPIVEANKNSKIALISQAPGRVVHQTGIAWNDQSGKTLREWLGVDKATFYDPSNFAILPMAFCYPGKAKTGDLPPRKECAPLWHRSLIKELRNIHLTILIGSYASAYYLPDSRHSNLTQKVLNYQEFLPAFLPLPHPSPVNRFWRTKNPWFEQEMVPFIQEMVKEVLQN